MEANRKPGKPLRILRKKIPHMNVLYVFEVRFELLPAIGLGGICFREHVLFT
jgi:hypothetical protein